MLLLNIQPIFFSWPQGFSLTRTTPLHVGTLHTHPVPQE